MTIYSTTAQGIDQHNIEKKKKPFDRASYVRKAYPLAGMPRKQYEGLLHSGMFFEFYPDATGDFEKDTTPLG